MQTEICFICLEDVNDENLKCSKCNIISHKSCMEKYTNKILKDSFVSDVRDPFTCPQCNTRYTHISELFVCCIPLGRITKLDTSYYEMCISCVAISGYIFVILFLLLNMNNVILISIMFYYI